MEIAGPYSGIDDVGLLDCVDLQSEFRIKDAYQLVAKLGHHDHVADAGVDVPVRPPPYHRQQDDVPGDMVDFHIFCKGVNDVLGHGFFSNGLPCLCISKPNRRQFMNNDLGPRNISIPSCSTTIWDSSNNW